jgi:hypothetical protein
LSSYLFKPSYLFSTSHPNPGLAIDILLRTFSINPTQKHQRQIKTQWKIKTDSLLRLNQLLENHHLRETMGENCRSIALAEYSLEQQSDRYIQLYRSLLGE